MTEIILSLVILSHFILQIYPRIFSPQNGIDLYRWLKYSREIRSNSFKFPKYIDKYIIKARFSYPPTFLLLLALFSSNFLEKFNYIISPLFSIIENLILFLIVFYITNSETISILSCIIYSSTPANIIENMFLGTRSLGQLCYFIYLISLYFYIFEEYSLYILVVSNSLVLVTHRMSTQLMLFTNIFISICLLDLNFIFSMILAVIFSIFITAGQYYMVLKGHLAQVIFYIGEFSSQLKGFFYFNKTFIFAIIGRNPYILLAGYLAITKNHELIDYFIIYLFTFIFFVAVITTFISILRSLGEGHRYIAYLNPLCAFFIAKNIPQDSYFLIFIFFIVSLVPVIYKFLQMKKINKDNNFYLTPRLKLFLDDYFKTKDHEIRFMSFPPNIDDYIAYKFTNSRVMFHDNGFALKDCFIVPFHLNPEKKLKKILEMHHIDLFISTKSYTLESYNLMEIDEIYVYEKIN